MRKIIDCTSRNEIKGRVRWVRRTGDDSPGSIRDEEAAGLLGGRSRATLLAQLEEDERRAAIKTAQGRPAHPRSVVYVKDFAAPGDGGAWWPVELG